ncbi:MAG: tyrosine-protein phosphatase [Oligoflexia bacterium]|nr:tyrosine-protein phosphatase [Oligoflexia bacterium]MBF0364065.1 tyrosine-protein phosphatase [Oligoflexia bacterium]
MLLRFLDRQTYVNFFVFFSLLLITLSTLFTLSTSTHASVRNLGTVDDGIYRGGRLYGHVDFQTLSELGVDTIINLEYFHKDSAALCHRFNFDCKKYGILLLPVVSTRFYHERFKAAFRAVLRARAEGKTVFFHCHHGSDRAGTLSAALMIRKRVCGKDYDPESLRKEISDTLLAYGFKARYFPNLYKEIISWTKNPPTWICD